MFSDYAGMPKEAKYLIYASIMPAVAYALIFTDSKTGFSKATFG